MDTIIRVATINILNDLSRWVERRELLVRELSALDLDLIGLQEVTDPLGTGTAHWLAEALGGYSVYICPKAGVLGRWEGVAILSRLAVERHETLDLESQQRTAQLVQVQLGGCPIVFVNGHYYWPPTAETARLRQVERVLEWLRPLPEGTSVIACGDYNGTPDSRAIVRMRQEFVSAHSARHGREPDFTFPTPLDSRRPVRSAISRWLLRRFTNRPGESWRGTLDYIFVRASVRVLECAVILDRPAPHDPGLYPSDHFGLAATLQP